MRIATTLGALAVLAACGQQTPASPPESGVRGLVLSGPQCPVATVETPCPDLIMPGTVVGVTTPGGSVVIETRTDAEGRFMVSVPPGRYDVQPAVEGTGVAFSKPARISVPPGTVVEVTLLVDTGIR